MWTRESFSPHLCVIRLHRGRCVLVDCVGRGVLRGGVFHHPAHILGRLVMSAVWWFFWSVEIIAAMILLGCVQYLRRKVRAANDLKPQLDFWRDRANMLDERLRSYARKRDVKGRFCGRVGE